MSDIKSALHVLGKYWGYDSFRPGQQALISALLSGRDVLGIMPTGAGKSICYEVPALLFPGTTIVVSPLISLMEDQVSGLRRKGISAAAVNSLHPLRELIGQTFSQGSLLNQPFPSWEINPSAAACPTRSDGHFYGGSSNHACQSSVPKILYVSPERLKSPDFLQYIQTIPVSFVCIDEAHCISKWGHDFRPEYLEIHDFIERVRQFQGARRAGETGFSGRTGWVNETGSSDRSVQSGRPRIAAFTATADALIKKEILDSLKLRNPYCLTTGFDRPNLFFAVERPKDRLAAMLHHVRRHPGECGIIYCNTRRTAGHLVNYLVRNGIHTEAYHAGLSDEVRSSVQERFLSGALSVIVATNAFGMGVDKPDIRFVIHFNMPKDMESYYQEAGRAGRDGFPAECILLFGANDIRAGHFFIDGRHPPEHPTAHRLSEREKLRTMIYYSAGRVCLRAFMLEYFGEHAPSYCGKCSVCLSGVIPSDPEGQKKVRRKGQLKIPVVPHSMPARRSSPKSEGSSVPLHSGYPFLTSKRKTPARPNELSTREYELYMQLLALRRRLGQEKRISPEKIFPDRILRAFATALPRTKFDMLFIEGISFLNVFRFGTPFLEEVHTHIYFYGL